MAKLSKHWKWSFTRNDSFHRSFGVPEILSYTVCVPVPVRISIWCHHYAIFSENWSCTPPLPHDIISRSLPPLLHIMNKNFAIIDVIIMQTHNLLPFCALPSGPRMNYCFLLMMLLMAVVVVTWNASSVLDGKVIWSAASQCFSHRITINDGENMKCNELFLFSLDSTTTTDIQHKDGCLYAPLKCDQRTEKKRCKIENNCVSHLFIFFTLCSPLHHFRYSV